MKFGIRPLDFAGFALTAAAALYQGWSLQEFCWSTWLACLCYSFACIVTAAFQILLTARSEKVSYEQRLPVLQQLPSNVYFTGMILTVILVVFVAFRFYTSIYSAFTGCFCRYLPKWNPIHFLDEMAS